MPYSHWALVKMDELGGRSSMCTNTGVSIYVCLVSVGEISDITVCIIEIAVTSSFEYSL